MHCENDEIGNISNTTFSLNNDNYKHMNMLPLNYVNIEDQLIVIDKPTNAKFEIVVEDMKSEMRGENVKIGEEQVILEKEQKFKSFEIVVEEKNLKMTDKNLEIGNIANIEHFLPTYHLKNHKVSVPLHSCSRCSMTFTLKCELTHHVMNNHCNKTVLFCDPCKTLFTRQHNYYMHNRQFHPEEYTESTYLENKNHLTSKEEKTNGTDERNKIKIMMNMHGKKIELGNIANIEHFLPTYPLNCHEVSVPQLSCSRCNMKFTLKCELTHHVMKNHCNKKILFCDPCKTLFIRQHSYYMHNRQFHPEEYTESTYLENKLPEKLHSCSVCSRTFTLPSHLALHMIAHSNTKPFACDACKKAFKCQRYLKMHNNYKHSGKNTGSTYSSKICNTVIEHKNHLTGSEEQVVVNEEVTDVQCTESEMSGENIEIDNISNTTFVKDEPTDGNYDFVMEDIKFEIKDENFDLSNTIFVKDEPTDGNNDFVMEDMKSELRDENVEISNISNITFVKDVPTDGNYENVVEDIKLKNRGDNVEIGNITKNTQISLNQAKCHIMPEKLHSCSICSETFTLQYHLDSHMITHEDDRQFKCCICQSEFQTQSILVSHYNLHTKIFSLYSHFCKICNRGFAKERYLTSHLRVHDIGRPYFCSNCSRTYTEKSQLISHIMNEHRLVSKRFKLVQPYSCLWCKKKFVNINQLITHMLIHTEEKPFVCFSCEGVFPQKRHLKLHLY